MYRETCLTLILLFLWSQLAWPQQIIMVRRRPAPAASTWTFVQVQSGRSAFLTNYNCSGAACTLNITTTGSGHAAFLFSYDGDSNTLSSVSGGCSGSWTVRQNQQNNQIGNIGMATCESTSAGATTITVTYSATPNSSLAEAYFYELAWSGSTIAHDTSGKANTTTGSTSIVGPTLTLTGSSDAIVQCIGAENDTPSAASSPYNTNFLNTTTDGGAVATAFVACSYVLNSSSGSAVTWTVPTSGQGITIAAAAKGS